MKIKLDENFGTRCVEEFVTRGHDVATVVGQGMSGFSDHELIDACRDEQRCIVTLDMDFANPLVFDARGYLGIAVVRLKGRVQQQEMLAAVRTLATRLSNTRIVGKTWIVQPGRVREYQQES